MDRSADLTYPDFNFGDVYDAIGNEFPDRLAIVYGEEKHSWGELDKRTNSLVRSLESLGLEPGSKIAFYLRNCPAYVEGWVACAKGRFVHANVNYRYVGQELEYLLSDCNAEAVIYNSEFRTEVEKLRHQLTGIKAWIEVGERTPPAFAKQHNQLCISADTSPLEIERSGDDVYLMYTGGTTGYPKGVMWPARNRIAVIQANDGATPDSHLESVRQQQVPPVAVVAAPMMHSMGLTTAMSTLFRGGCVVLLKSSGFDPKLCVAEIERNRAQSLSIAGDAFALPLLQYLQESGHQHDISSIEVVRSAGAMWSEHLKQPFFDYIPDAVLSDSLGSSEGSGLGSSLRKRGDVGRTAQFTAGPHVKVLREDLTEAETGEVGLLALAGPLPIGYYNDPEKTREVFPVIDGRQYSIAGDKCKVDAEGNLTLLGRGNNCINSGGEKIFPEEVEEAIKQIAGVNDAAVAGVIDDRFGEAVAALITTSVDIELTASELRSSLESRIARYKHPRHVFFLDHNEYRHDNGKINYPEVKRMLAVLM